MSLFISPANRATNANNLALSGAKWYFYLSGTLTPADVYTTSALDTAHTNPVVADAGGLFADVYLDPAVTYRAILKDALGNTISDTDPYDFAFTGSTVATRAILAAIAAPAAGNVRTLTESGRDGEFVFDDSDLSAEVTADEYQGVYVPPSTDTTGASGAWVRSHPAPYARRTFDAAWFGCLPDGATNNRERMKSATDLLHTLGGGELTLGVGTFAISASDADGSYLRGLALDALTDVTITGSGRGTVLKITDTGDLNQVKVLNIVGCTNVTVQNLTVHGNADDAAFVTATADDDPEQMAGVLFQDNDGVTLKNVWPIQTQGDAFTLSSTSGNVNQNIKLIDCGHHDNARNGITFGGYGWDQVHVVRHYFGANVDTQQIDCEPLGDGTFRGIYVTDPFCLMTDTGADEYSFVFAGFAADATTEATFAEDVIVRGGNITGGISLAYVSNVLIEGVRSISCSNTNRAAAIEIHYGATDVTIRDCPNINFSVASGGTDGTIYIVEKAVTINGTPTRFIPKRITIENCGITGNGQLIYAQDCDYVSVLNNRFWGPTSGFYLAFSASEQDILRPRVEGNTFDATTYAGADNLISWSNGVGTYFFKGATFINNKVLGANVSAVNYTNLGTTTPFDLVSCAFNDIPTTAKLFREASSQHPNRLLIGGSPLGGSAIYSCKGTPEAVITANIGSIAIRRDGTAGTIYYAKESGTGNTGWKRMTPLRGSKTQDWADLATATQQTTTVTVTGAALGDRVAVAMSTALSGTRIWGEVTAADTVTVYHRNDTGGNVNVASGTLSVDVL